MLLEVNNMGEDKKIPFKNYVILSIILLLSIVGVIYFYMWYSEIEENRMGTPIMDDPFCNGFAV